MQKINLYQAEFHDIRSSQKTVVYAAVAVLALVLAGVNVGQAIAISHLKETLAQEHQVLETKQISLEALRKNARPIARDMDMAALVDSLRNANAEKTRAISYLSGNETSNDIGFSHLLQSLGRQRDSIDDIWLTRIKFSDGGFNMRLDGSCYKPELLPEFIQALNREVLYKDREFRDLRITRPDTGSHTIQFLLDTRERDAIDSKSRDALSLAMFMAKLKQLSENDQAVH